VSSTVHRQSLKILDSPHTKITGNLLKANWNGQKSFDNTVKYRIPVRSWGLFLDHQEALLQSGAAKSAQHAALQHSPIFVTTG
jgi:hypothetical protein